MIIKRLINSDNMEIKFSNRLNNIKEKYGKSCLLNLYDIKTNIKSVNMKKNGQYNELERIQIKMQ